MCFRLLLETLFFYGPFSRPFVAVSSFIAGELQQQWAQNIPKRLDTFVAERD
jgi:hypothetical protein